MKKKKPTKARPKKAAKKKPAARVSVDRVSLLVAKAVAGACAPLVDRLDALETGNRTVTQVRDAGPLNGVQDTLIGTAGSNFQRTCELIGRLHNLRGSLGIPADPEPASDRGVEGKPALHDLLRSTSAAIGYCHSIVDKIESRTH